MKRLFLIDVLGYLFRSYYALPQMNSPTGVSTHALYGFVRSMLKLIEDFSPEHLVAVYDGPDAGEAREGIYAEYKAHRQPAPEDLPGQIQLSEEFCRLAGIPQLRLPGYEADDLIASITSYFANKGVEILICSSDKDLCQLVGENVFMLQTHKENRRLDAEGVFEQYGVHPDQILDLLALVGDAADNIPGVRGFGMKTAAKVLNEIGPLEELLANPERVPGPKKVEALREEAERARLSKQLATLLYDLPIPKKESFYQRDAEEEAELLSFYREMGFRSLVQKKEEENPSLSHPKPSKKKGAPAPPKTELIEDQAALRGLIKELKGAKEIIFDTETTSLNPIDARIVGVGLASTEQGQFYLPFNGSLERKEILAALAPLFNTPSIGFIAHHAKYDLHLLVNEGLPLPRIQADTLLASHLLDPHLRQHSLDALAERHLNFHKTPIHSLIGKGHDEITMDQVPIPEVALYCGEDLWVTEQLYHLFLPQLKELSLQKAFEEIELPLIPVLVAMEQAGVFVDCEQLKQLSTLLTKEATSLAEEIYEAAGERFNIHSPKQLSSILFEKLGLTPPKKTATGYSTNVEALSKLHSQTPLAQQIIDYRTLEKLRATYVDALPQQINPKTGRIHATFQQSGTATGRLSCQNPNLQNIPIKGERGGQIRSAFRPQKKNWLYLSADYSQVELRLLAHLSQDPHLLKAFHAGEDIHAATASLIFETPLEKVSKEERQQAKAVNFGILYGQKAHGLSQGLGIGRREAAAIIDSYFARFPHIEAYLEATIEEARERGAARTMTGRIRQIPEITSRNALKRQAAERLAINTPLQGSAADLIKIAMIDIHRQLQQAQSRSFLIVQIHDELLFEFPEEEAEWLNQVVKNSMEGVWDLDVPLLVQINVGKNWKEC